MFWVPVSNCFGIKAPYKTNRVQIVNAVQNTKLIDFSQHNTPFNKMVNKTFKSK